MNSKTSTVLQWVITILLAAGGWAGKEIYTEVRATHDVVLTFKTGTEIEVAAIKVRLTALELEVQKLKEAKR